jgi:hypothetical protein
VCHWWTREKGDLAVSKFTGTIIRGLDDDAKDTGIWTVQVQEGNTSDHRIIWTIPITLLYDDPQQFTDETRRL